MSGSGHMWNEIGIPHSHFTGISDYCCDRCGFVLDYVEIDLFYEKGLEAIWKMRKAYSTIPFECDSYIVKVVLES